MDSAQVQRKLAETKGLGDSGSESSDDRRRTPGQGSAGDVPMPAAAGTDVAASDPYHNRAAAAGQLPTAKEHMVCPTCGSSGPMCEAPAKGEWGPLTVWAPHSLDVNRLDGARHQVPNIPPTQPPGKISDKLRLDWILPLEGTGKTAKKKAAKAKKAAAQQAGIPRDAQATKPGPKKKVKAKQMPISPFSCKGKKGEGKGKGEPAETQGKKRRVEHLLFAC